MADSGDDGAENVSEPTESSRVDGLSSAPGQTTVENVPVLLTQGEEPGTQIVLSLAPDTATDLSDSEDHRNEINALADEVVKSSIDLAVSEHEQVIAQTAKSLTDQVVTNIAMNMEIRDRAMSLADKVVTGVTMEFDTLTEGPDSVFGDTYLEPVPDPYNKAIAYLEKHNILQLFQGLTSNVVLHQPTDPLEAMVEQLEILKNPKPSAESIGNSQFALQLE